MNGFAHKLIRQLPSPPKHLPTLNIKKGRYINFPEDKAIRKAVNDYGGLVMEFNYPLTSTLHTAYKTTILSRLIDVGYNALIATFNKDFRVGNLYKVAKYKGLLANAPYDDILLIQQNLHNSNPNWTDKVKDEELRRFVKHFYKHLNLSFKDVEIHFTGSFPPHLLPYLAYCGMTSFSITQPTPLLQTFPFSYQQMVELTNAFILKNKLRELVEAIAPHDPSLFDSMVVRGLERRLKKLELTTTLTPPKRRIAHPYSYYDPISYRVRRRLLERFVPPPHKHILHLINCSMVKPYTSAPSNQKLFSFLLQYYTREELNSVHFAVVEEEFGLVPYTYNFLPELDRDGTSDYQRIVVDTLTNFFRKYGNTYKVIILQQQYYELDWNLRDFIRLALQKSNWDGELIEVKDLSSPTHPQVLEEVRQIYTTLSLPSIPQKKENEYIFTQIFSYYFNLTPSHLPPITIREDKPFSLLKVETEGFMFERMRGITYLGDEWADVLRGSEYDTSSPYFKDVNTYAKYYLNLRKGDYILYNNKIYKIIKPPYLYKKIEDVIERRLF